MPKLHAIAKPNAMSLLIRVPTRTGKMGRHFPSRENHTKHWKSPGIEDKSL